jgi:hypothetical protein
LLGLGTGAVAQVSGRLLMAAYKPAPAPAPARPSCYWELENGFKEVKADRVSAKRELAVVLVGEGTPAAGSDRIEVPWNGGSLLPSTVVARVGATVLFRNDDEVAHELYAVGLEGLPVEATSPRARRSFQAAEAGNWPLRDKAVTHAEGHLHVLPDLIAVGTVQADGTFSFPEVAPGKYTLKVFHGSQELAAQAVEATGKSVTLEPIALTAPAAPAPEAK